MLQVLALVVDCARRRMAVQIPHRWCHFRGYAASAASGVSQAASDGRTARNTGSWHVRHAPTVRRRRSGFALVDSVVVFAKTKERIHLAPWYTKRRFDLIELAMIVGAVALTVALSFRASQARLGYVLYSAAQEGNWLREQYGPGRYSQGEEEWIVRDYFQDRHDGFFVDVGANHYRYNSNTFYLDTRLGWSGLAIDPQPDFATDYRRYRPRTRFFSFFISDTSNTDAQLYVVDGAPLVASQDQGFAERLGSETKNPIVDARAVTVPTIRLSDLLDQAGVSHFDFLSVDVELAEPKVLAGFDIERFHPSLVCIEAHTKVRQQVLDYFCSHGYVLLGKYLRADLLNLYFAPLSAVRATAPTTRPGAPK